LTSLGPINSTCGGIADASNTLELTGQGKYNNSTASFRVCVADNGHPGNGNGSAADQFHLECVDGCTYSTSVRVTSNALGGGNIDVDRAPEAGEAGSATTSGDAGGPAGNKSAGPYATPSGETESDDSGVYDSAGYYSADYDPAAPETLILDPVLLSEVTAGKPLALSVSVYDGYQRSLANASVSISIVSGGATQTVTAVSDLTGTCVFLLTGLATGAEYVATAGNAVSNAISVTPLGVTAGGP
jgi:hypothetical protein